MYDTIYYYYIMVRSEIMRNIAQNKTSDIRTVTRTKIILYRGGEWYLYIYTRRIHISEWKLFLFIFLYPR